NRPGLVWRQRSELIGDMAGATNPSGLLDGIGTLILDDIEERAAIGEKGLEPGDYQVLEVAGGNASSIGTVLHYPGDERCRHVVSIACSLLDGMARCQSLSVLVKNHAGEQARVFGIRSRS